MQAGKKYLQLPFFIHGDFFYNSSLENLEATEWTQFF